MREGQVDDAHRATGATERRGQRVTTDEQLRRTGAGHDQVGIGELSGELGHRDRDRAVLGGQSVGVGRGAVDDRDPLGTAARDVGDGQRGHRSGADDEDAGAGDRHRAALERRTHQGGGRAVDLGLGVRALADAQRLLEERVEGRPDGAVLLAQAQRVTGLAEDLALADDHRLQAGRDAEEVGHRALVVVDVEVREELLGRLAGPLDEQARDVLDAAVEAVDLGIDLEPVARDDRRRLGDVRATHHVGDQLEGGIAVEGETLQEGHGGRLVGDPDDENAHEASSAPAATALRCSW